MIVENQLSSLIEERIIRFVKRSLDTQQVLMQTHLQTLWNGQGHIIRLLTDAPAHEQVIVKYIAPTNQAAHPRGWNTSTSYARKVNSYEVEGHWYTRYASRCSKRCKVPALLGLEQDQHTTLILLEDLDTVYPSRATSLSVEQATVCLQWLAEFHALFLFDTGDGLWQQGCYWHLATRQDEWQAMSDSPVKQAATWLDAQLRQTQFQTLVHGDAKLANFCFSQDFAKVAAVDFQYVGRGCGMSDVAYFLGSCLNEHDCEHYEKELLDAYFAALRQSVKQCLTEDAGFEATHLAAQQGSLCDELETQWRALYAIAWTDFYRFLLGWMPGHAKINGYTEKLAVCALEHW